MHYLEKELNELVKQKNVFDFLQSGLSDGVWFWDIENPQQEWMSPQFKKLFGYEEDEIENTSEWWQKNIHPDDLKLAIKNFELHCADPTHKYDQIVRYKHKDKSTVWVRCRGIAIRDEQGKPIRMLGIHTDLTALKKAEEESLLKQLIFDEVVNVANIGTFSWLMEEDQWVFSDSWHKIHGTLDNHISSSDLLKLAHPHDIDEIDKNFQSAIKYHTPYILKHRIIKQNSGEIRYVKASGKVFKTGDGMMLVGAVIDITDEEYYKKKLLERKNALEQSNEELAAFAYKASHDLKTPLTNIKALSNLILESIHEEDFQSIEEDLKVISEQTGILIKLLDNTLEFSKIDSNENKNELIDIREEIHLIQNEFHEQIEKNKIRFKFKVEELKKLYFSKNFIKLILTHLISNSVKFSDQDKSDSFIHLNINIASSLYIEIEDNGIGFSEEIEDTVFSMFKRGSHDISYGSGLGLYMVKKIVLMNNGKVSAKGKVGEGSKFIINIPLEDER